VSGKFKNFVHNFQLALEKDVAETGWKNERDNLQKLEKELKNYRIVIRTIIMIFKRQKNVLPKPKKISLKI